MCTFRARRNHIPIFTYWSLILCYVLLYISEVRCAVHTHTNPLHPSTCVPVPISSTETSNNECKQANIYQTNRRGLFHRIIAYSLINSSSPLLTRRTVNTLSTSISKNVPPIVHVSLPTKPIQHVSAATNLSSQNPITSTMTGNSAWINGIKNAIASACAAACCKAILQPIDAMKTMQQYYIRQQSLSLYDAAQLLIQKPGGYRNLYAGLGVTMIGSMPSVGIYFGVYSYCKQRLLSTRIGKQYTTASIALSAAIGNTVASITRVPYEVMKQNLQTGLYDTTWSMIRDMISNPSTISQLLFPKGSVYIQMIRDVPYAIVTLLLYESLQSYFRNKTANGTNKRKSPLHDAMLGGFAGGVGSWVTNPMDVIKTRLQTDTNSVIYHGSIINCCTSVWEEGGISAFLRGSVPRLVHKVPANAFFFLFYEFFRQLLHVGV